MPGRIDDGRGCLRIRELQLDGRAFRQMLLYELKRASSLFPCIMQQIRAAADIKSSTYVVRIHFAGPLTLAGPLSVLSMTGADEEGGGAGVQACVDIGTFVADYKRPAAKTAGGSRRPG